MLERRGATVLRCPLVTILDAPDPAPVLDWIRWFARGACDDLILLTGEGLRRLLSCIDKHEPSLREDFVAQLARVRKITRGPKPARALRELGLKSGHRRRVADHRRRHRVARCGAARRSQRRRAALRHGAQRAADRFPERRRRARARRCTLHLRDEERRCCGDCVARSHVARRGGCDRVHERCTGRSFVCNRTCVAQVQAALARTRVAAVGPIVADALAQRAIHVASMPQDSFFMKPLTSCARSSVRRARRSALSAECWMSATCPLDRRGGVHVKHFAKYTARIFAEFCRAHRI